MRASSSSPTTVLIDDGDPELAELAAVPVASPGVGCCIARGGSACKR